LREYWNNETKKGETSMQEPLLEDIQKLIADLKHKEATTIHTVPNEVIRAIQKAKHLERLLLEIFNMASGSGGIDMSSFVRREFGIRSEVIDHMDRWAPYSKEQFEDALHDAIDRAEIRAGKMGMFFEGSAPKKETNHALELLKNIAHAAIKCQFGRKPAGSDLYVEILHNLIQFYAHDLANPSGNQVKYRTLISADRLYIMSGHNDSITAALKAYCREWYQQSSFEFLENKETYPSYEYVQHFLYALTDEQLERLRADYIRHIADEFKLIKARPELHRAEYLKTMLETVLSWRTEG
jgi:hypothetical protein